MKRIVYFLICVLIIFTIESCNKNQQNEEISKEIKQKNNRIDNKTIEHNKSNITYEVYFEVVFPFVDKRVKKNDVLKIIEETFKYKDLFDPLLLNAIIIVESNYDYRAISHRNSLGLMQINYKIWKEKLRKEKIIKEKQDLFKIDKNISSGVYILNHYYQKTNNLDRALYLYSGRSKKYVSRVKSIYLILKKRKKRILENKNYLKSNNQGTF